MLAASRRRLSLAVKVEPIAARLGIVGRAWHVIQAIIGGRECSIPIKTLIWLAGLGSPCEGGDEVLIRLEREGWLSRGGPVGYEEGTLTPLAAEHLGVTLTYPERDSNNLEPRWILSNLEPGGCFDRTGLHEEEPKQFINQLDRLGLILSRLRERDDRSRRIKDQSGRQLNKSKRRKAERIARRKSKERQAA